MRRCVFLVPCLESCPEVFSSARTYEASLSDSPISIIHPSLSFCAWEPSPCPPPRDAQAASAVPDSGTSQVKFSKSQLFN